MNDFPARYDIILTLEGTVTCGSVQLGVPKWGTIFVNVSAFNNSEFQEQQYLEVDSIWFQE
jgi:hypothetical protein